MLSSGDSESFSLREREAGLQGHDFREGRAHTRLLKLIEQICTHSCTHSFNTCQNFVADRIASGTISGTVTHNSESTGIYPVRRAFTRPSCMTLPTSMFATLIFLLWLLL